MQRQALRNEPRSQDRNERICAFVRALEASPFVKITWNKYPNQKREKISNRIKEKEWSKWEWMLDVYREDEMCILAGLGIHSSSLMHLCTSMSASSQAVLSSRCFRPCWRHKGSFALMYPTSPSIWASQGNSFMLVRCSLCKYVLLLIQVEIRACINLDSLCLLITLMIPRSPSRNLQS